MAWEDWVDGGERTSVPVAGGRHQVWNRVIGRRGPWTTFLHGFPTSSYDWHAVARSLPPGRRRLYVDHLGFGASDKPRIDYTFDRQIAALQQVWLKHGVEETMIVAHDYSVSMAQEILWRHLRGTWDGPRITGFTLLNGGLAYSKQQRLPIQVLLRGPFGPLVARMAKFDRFRESMHRICAVVPSDEELEEHWRAMTSAQGKAAIPRISQYHGERKRRESEWLAALQYSQHPIQLLWGLADPISGRPMLDHIKHRTKNVRAEARDDIGHYPQLEDPEWVARWIGRMEKRTAMGRPET